MVKAILASALLGAAAAIGNGLVGIDLGNEFMKVSLVKPGMPFQIVTNYESKRKTSSVVGFYKGERLFGPNAENILSRRPKHVFVAPQRALGRNFTHPLLVDYANNSFLASDLVPNGRDGATFLVPVAESGFEFLLAPDETAAAKKAGSSSDSATATPTDAPAASTIPFAAEELAGMLMGHARDFAQAFSGGPVMDAVLTVPSYYTQNERLALLDAASLAGLNVLSLVDENVAAAIHYGIDRVFENGTHHMVLYNMGAEAAQATLFAFDAYVTVEKGKNKTVGQARVLAKAWEAGLGGRHFDAALINYVAEKFNAEKGATLPAAAKGDIRNVPQAMAKIRRNVVKAKEVLSANEEIGASFESVLPDVDFRVQLSRKLLEEVAAPLLARVTSPIASVLAQAGIPVGSIDVIELVGGAVRMPRVQALLKEFVAAAAANVTAAAAEGGATTGAGPTLGQHLNGDEAMALGAAFLAANRSTAFRVRRVGMLDAYPWPIGVRLAQLHSGPTAAAAASASDSEPASEASATTPAAKAWSKRSSLFKAYNGLDSVKRISFTAERDLRAALFYEAASPSVPLPDGTARELASYNITGIDELLASLAAQYNTTLTLAPAAAVNATEGEAAAAPGNATVVQADASGAYLVGIPKVHVSFELDINGIARLLRAEATVDEEFLVTVTPTPTPAASSSASASKAAPGSSSASASPSTAATADEEAASESESASASATASAAESAEASPSTAAAGERKLAEDESASASGSPTAAPSPVVKTVRRTLRFPLTVSADTRGALPVQPLSASDKASAQLTVRRLAKADDEKRAREGAKNALEGYIYATRDKLGNSEVEEGLPEVTTDEQREALREGLMEGEDWLYGDGTSATVEVYRKKLRDLKDVVEPPFFRLEERKARAGLLNDTVTFVGQAKALVAKWNTTHPQITSNETADALASIAKFEAWFNETRAKQAALEDTVAPVLTREAVGGKMKPVSDLLTRLARKPRPTPSPTPKPAKKAASDEDDFDGEEGAAVEEEEATEGEAKATKKAPAKDSGKGGKKTKTSAKASPAKSTPSGSKKKAQASPSTAKKSGAKASASTKAAKASPARASSAAKGGKKAPTPTPTPEPVLEEEDVEVEVPASEAAAEEEEVEAPAAAAAADEVEEVVGSEEEGEEKPEL